MNHQKLTPTSQHGLAKKKGQYHFQVCLSWVDSSGTSLNYIMFQSIYSDKNEKFKMIMASAVAFYIPVTTFTCPRKDRRFTIQ